MGNTRRLSTSDLASRFDRTPGTIRVWHAKGLLPKAHKDISGKLYWTPKQILEFAKEQNLDMEGTT